MTKAAQNVLEIMDILPEEEQELLYEMAKRLVLAWDPDYTKGTPKERAEMEEKRNDRKGRPRMFDEDGREFRPEVVEAMEEARRLSRDPNTKKYDSFEEILREFDI